MLKSNQGTIQIQGTKLDLLAEFTHLVDKLLTQHVFTEEDIDMCLKHAKMSPEEKVAEIEKVIKDSTADDILSALKILLE